MLQHGEGSVRFPIRKASSGCSRRYGLERVMGAAGRLETVAVGKVRDDWDLDDRDCFEDIGKERVMRASTR